MHWQKCFQFCLDVSITVGLLSVAASNFRIGFTCLIRFLFVSVNLYSVLHFHFSISTLRFSFLILFSTHHSLYFRAPKSPITNTFLHLSFFMSVPDSFKAQINQGVPGNVKARPDPLPAGKKIAPNKKLPCEFDTPFEKAATKAPVGGRDSATAESFAEVEKSLAEGDWSTAIRILWYLKLNTYINEDSANVWAYVAFAFAHLGFSEHVGFAFKKMQEAGLAQTVLTPETMTELKKISK